MASNNNNNLKYYLELFKKTYKISSKANYCSDVKQIETLCKRINNHSISIWIDEAIDNKQSYPVDWILQKIVPLIQKSSWPKRIKDDRKSRFKKFAEVVFGIFYANTWMSLVTDDDLLCSIVAQNALFPREDVVKEVCEGKLGTNFNIGASSVPGYNNPFASWDYMSSYRDTSRKKGTPPVDDPDFLVNSIKYPGISKKMKPDDNSNANQYIKRAIKTSIEREYGLKLGGTGYQKFYDYEACHVWAKPGERQYYASIANLVLLPRALAQLTDHNDAVKNLLRCEVYKRFGFIPEGEKLPDDPNKNNKYSWRVL